MKVQIHRYQKEYTTILQVSLKKLQLAEDKNIFLELLRHGTAILIVISFMKQGGNCLFIILKKETNLLLGAKM